MARLALAISFAALLAGSSAQDATENVWGVVSFILYGERTPLRSETPASLTPIGAQQMFEQGTMFRARYLEPNSTLTADENAVTTKAPILGLSDNAIDNSMITILSTADEYVATSALSFLQGLYPPINQSFADGAGGLEAAVLADGSMVNFPLGGYQYPLIQTLSVLDPNSVWIQGQAACTEYIESILNYSNDSLIQTVYQQTLPFFQNLWANVYANAFPRSMANWYYAYEIYDYVSYHFEHNEAIQTQMSAGELAILREYASTQQRDLNGNLSSSGLTQGDMIRAVSGRTMAAKVVALLKESVASGGEVSLNLMFGSFEPFISFFALSDLINGPSGGDFQPLPYPGAAMIFEMYTVGGNTSLYPSIDDLWVRFLYRNGTDPAAPFLEYPLFGNSPSASAMTFNDFVNSMETITMDSVSQWCDTCDSVNLFCSALSDNSYSNPDTSSDSGHATLSPAVAGVIGAIIALAVIGIAALLAMLVGGLRFYRTDPKRRNSTLGGFRGAEKMASDTDLAYSKGGARHERTGSWELRDGGKPGDPNVPAAAVVKTRDFARSNIKNVDDDSISVLGHTPVSPVESV